MGPREGNTALVLSTGVPQMHLCLGQNDLGSREPQESDVS